MPDDGTEEFSFPADINTEISSEHIFVPKGTSMHDVEHALKAELGKSLPPSGMPEPPEPIPVKVAEQPVRVILEPGEAPFEPTEAVVKEALQTGEQEVKREAETPPVDLRTKIERLALAALSVEEIVETLAEAKKYLGHVKGVVDRVKQGNDIIKDRLESKLGPMGEREKREEMIKQRVYRRLLDIKSDEGKEVANRIIQERENTEDSSLFKLIQAELDKLQENPNDELEKELRKSMSVLTKMARDQNNPDRSLWASMRDRIDDQQHALARNSWETVEQSINGIDTANMETEESGNTWWSRDFSGMLDKYRDVALIHMNKALLEEELKELTSRTDELSDEDKSKQEKLEENIDKFDRQLKLQPWSSTPPVDLRNIASEYLKHKDMTEEERAAEDEDVDKAELPRRYDGAEYSWLAQPAQVPDYYGAVFESSRYKQLVIDRAIAEGVPIETLPVLDVSNEADRERWILENMRVFTDGTVENSEAKWRGVVDLWLSDLRRSAENYMQVLIEAKVREENPGLFNNERANRAKIREKKAEINRTLIDTRRELFEDVKKSEEQLKAFMAVAASSKAMDASDGAGSKYTEFIAPGPRGADLDKQDDWYDFIIHGNPEAYRKVIDNTYVRHYYKMLLKQAGINLIDEASRGTDGGVKGSKFTVDKKKVDNNGLLIQSLRDKAKQGGFREWINKTIESDTSSEVRDLDDSIKWAAAKSACDAFLIDKFTRWSYMLTDKGKIEKRDYGFLFPTQSWGGDPLRSVLEPSFLPHRIKSMYQESDDDVDGKSDSVIMTLTDSAFRPDDVVKVDELVPVSMIGTFKDYARYSDALYTFIGGSRAPEIASWSKETLEKNLPQIIELLDTIYGHRTFHDSRIGQKIKGKEVVGLMVARILETKALAAAAETARPSFGEQLMVVFGEQQKSPLDFAVQYVWGPKYDGRSGLLAKIASGRTRISFKGNPEAEKALQNTWDILKTNDQDADGRRRLMALMALGFAWDLAVIINDHFITPKKK